MYTTTSYKGGIQLPSQKANINEIPSLIFLSPEDKNQTSIQRQGQASVTHTDWLTEYCAGYIMTQVFIRFQQSKAHQWSNKENRQKTKDRVKHGNEFKASSCIMLLL